MLTVLNMGYKLDLI